MKSDIAASGKNGPSRPKAKSDAVAQWLAVADELAVQRDDPAQILMGKSAAAAAAAVDESESGEEDDDEEDDDDDEDDDVSAASEKATKETKELPGPFKGQADTRELEGPNPDDLVRWEEDLRACGIEPPASGDAARARHVIVWGLVRDVLKHDEAIKRDFRNADYDAWLGCVMVTMAEAELTKMKPHGMTVLTPDQLSSFNRDC